MALLQILLLQLLYSSARSLSSYQDYVTKMNVDLYNSTLMRNDSMPVPQQTF